MKHCAILRPHLAALLPWLALGLCAPLAAQAQPKPLNDTGITWSGQATSGNRSGTDCNAADPAGQDCHHGRDRAAADGTLAKVGGGGAGFDFTKISNSGNALPASASLGSGPGDWACTRDNVTGLIWEVKVNDAGHLRHMDHTYTWYMTGSPDGNNGTASGGTCKDAGRCDTEKFTADVNAANLCGHNDWRMPTVKELEGIADLGRTNPAIDPTYFPNTPSSDVWSGSPYAGFSNFAWYVHFSFGDAYGSGRNFDDHVRLVRVGQ